MQICDSLMKMCHPKIYQYATQTYTAKSRNSDFSPKHIRIDAHICMHAYIHSHSGHTYSCIPVVHILCKWEDILHLIFWILCMHKHPLCRYTYKKRDSGHTYSRIPVVQILTYKSPHIHVWIDTYFHARIHTLAFLLYMYKTHTHTHTYTRTLTSISPPPHMRIHTHLLAHAHLSPTGALKN